MPTRAILVHGMGRSSLSMTYMALRLEMAGIKTHCFNYSAMFETFEQCEARLQRLIERRYSAEPYVIVAHSLGSVVTRKLVPRLDDQPLGCVLLAPPIMASRAAKQFKPKSLFRIVAGSMGQALMDDKFMAGLSMPAVPILTFIGTAGRGIIFSFDGERNDGVLAVSEATPPSGRMQHVETLHSFIMNSDIVIRETIAFIRELENAAHEIPLQARIPKSQPRRMEI